MLLVLIAFLFGPGLIPYYLVVRSLGLVNTFWMMVVPGRSGSVGGLYLSPVSLWSCRQTWRRPRAWMGPATLMSSGCVVLPLSLPVYAVFGLFNVVYHWNDFLTTAIFVTNPDLHPLAFILQRTLTMVSRWSSGISPAAGNDAAVTAEAVGGDRKYTIQDVRGRAGESADHHAVSFPAEALCQRHVDRDAKRLARTGEVVKCLN